MSKQSRKGATFERMVADYMKSRTGQSVDRRVKRGWRDMGDIAGFQIGGFDCVVECKNCQRIELSKWLHEADDEMQNAEASYGVVVHKRRGYGDAHVGGSYVTMTLDTFLDICKEVER